MKTLTEVEERFLESAKPRLLKALSMFSQFDKLNYDGYTEPDLVTYRKKFFLNSFIVLTGSLFFISRNIFQYLPTEAGKDLLMDDYIDFCRVYDRKFSL